VWASIRIRSPRIAPPLNGELGSTATTATVRPPPRATRTSASTNVLLPAPRRPGDADHLRDPGPGAPAEGAADEGGPEPGLAVLGGGHGPGEGPPLSAGHPIEELGGGHGSTT
jgi:hypothetical protein